LGIKDHADKTTVSKGNHLLCKALSAQSSSAAPSCLVTFKNAGSYTIGNLEDIKSDHDGVWSKYSCEAESLALAIMDASE